MLISEPIAGAVWPTALGPGKKPRAPPGKSASIHGLHSTGTFFAGAMADLAHTEAEKLP